MTHEFHGGLTNPTRTIVQQGIVDLLQPLTIARGGYLVDVVKVGSVVRSYTDLDGLAQLSAEMNGRAPAIGVATGDRSFNNTGIGGKETQGTLRVLLYFVDKHARGLYAGRLESDQASRDRRTSDPGIHVMMQHALEMLMGQYPTRIAAERQLVRQLRCQHEDELGTFNEVSIWMQTWQCETFDRAYTREWLRQPDKLTSVHARVTTDASEANRPSPATISTSIDVDTDLT